MPLISCLSDVESDRDNVETIGGSGAAETSGQASSSSVSDSALLLPTSKDKVHKTLGSPWAKQVSHIEYYSHTTDELKMTDCGTDSLFIAS